MKNKISIFLIVISSILFSDSFEVNSPDKNLKFKITNDNGSIVYSIHKDNENIINSSSLGFMFANKPDFYQNLFLSNSSTSSFSETWEQPWGENRYVLNNYNELAVDITDTNNRTITFRVRAYNEGIGFRYEFPKSFVGDELIIQDELTSFNVNKPKPNSVWWLKAYQKDRYEYRYSQNSIDDVDASHTPLTLKTDQNHYISIHEASLLDYSSMVLRGDGQGSLSAELVAAYDGTKSKHYSSFVTPWRTIHITDNAVDLVNSMMILNLNEPNQLGDVSWVEPGIYMGIWWGMHIGENTWSTGEKLGATTDEMYRYIDFVSEHGLDGLLVEGWNIGWDGNWIENGPLFKFDQTTDFFDMPSIAEYADKKGVNLVMHNETSGHVPNYEEQMDAAYDFLEKYGVNHLKTGYVGFANGYPFLGKETARPGETGEYVYEWNHGQKMINHFTKSVIESAKRKIALNVHEPIKPTGLRRTFPNMMTREGVRGQEYNAWSDGNDPQHTTILPFTRMLGGPMDFTPGVFDVWFKGEDDPSRIRTTVAKQLALMVVLYSPLQMAADLPRNYAKRLDVFQFIKDVPSDWEESIALDGEIADFIVMARRQKNSENWFIGGITDENSRKYTLDFSFLGDGNYEAIVYKDGKNADWSSNPFPVDIEKYSVNKNSTLSLQMANGGGFAISVFKK